MDTLSALLLPGFQIVWINILLSGDNAVVIALACRNLPDSQRRIGLLAGAGAAVGLRIVFTLVTNSILGVPWLKFVGGVLLLWIAVKLLTDDHDEAGGIQPASTLRSAVQTIALADVVMSLDNVLAIAAIADGNIWLIVFGLLVSIPLVVAGSQIILTMLKRAPWIVWAGAALLGWVAGEIMTEDPGLTSRIGEMPHVTLPISGFDVDIGLAPLCGAALVVLIGLAIKRARRPAIG